MATDMETTEKPWYEQPDMLHRVAEWFATCWADKPIQIVEMYTRPWDFDDEYQGYMYSVESLDAEIDSLLD